MGWIRANKVRLNPDKAEMLQFSVCHSLVLIMSTECTVQLNQHVAFPARDDLIVLLCVCVHSMVHFLHGVGQGGGGRGGNLSCWILTSILGRMA